MLTRAGALALAFCVGLGGAPSAWAQPAKPMAVPAGQPGDDEEARPAGTAAGKKVQTETEKTEKLQDDKTKTKPKPTSDDEDMPTHSTGPADGTRGR